MAAFDTLEAVIEGKGSHGAMPHQGVGNGSDEGGRNLHSPHYDFNDAVLPRGLGYRVRLAEMASSRNRQTPADLAELKIKSHRKLLPELVAAFE
jgi:metal-dependent amidase/aminoacylase/carboxypeptidase family protein